MQEVWIIKWVMLVAVVCLYPAFYFETRLCSNYLRVNYIALINACPRVEDVLVISGLSAETYLPS